MKVLHVTIGLFLIFIVGIFFVGKVRGQANNKIVVTATVPDDPTKLSVVVESTPSAVLGPDKTTDITITYGSQLIAPIIPLTLEVQWLPGAVAGGGTAQVLSYVIGSATPAYGGTAAVYDPYAGTIRWTIPNFPGGTTNQKVSLQLRTIPTYTGPNEVVSTVAVHMKTPTSTVPDTSTTIRYQFPYVPLPTIATTPTPGNPEVAIKNVQQKVEPLIFDEPQVFAITDVTLTGISPLSARLSATTNQQSTATIKYGTTPGTMNEMVKDVARVKERTIVLDTLQRATRYYAQITVRNAKGEVRISDILTFVTANSSIETEVDPNSVAINTHEVLINSLNPTETKNGTVAVLPINTAYNFRFIVTKKVPLRSVKAIVRNSNVLGVNNRDTVEPVITNSNLFSPSMGVYQGRLKIPSKKGLYDVIIRFENYEGAVYEQPIATIHAVSPFTILTPQKKPARWAKVQLYRYDANKKLFKEIPSQALNIPSFVRTDGQGQLKKLVLPFGIYKAKMSAWNFAPMEHTFTIGSYEKDVLPTIVASKQSMNVPLLFLSIYEYTWDIVTTIGSSIHDALDNFPITF